MAAEIQVHIFTGATESAHTRIDDDSGIKFGLEGVKSDTTPVQIPTSTGTKYSYWKNIAFYVISTDTTTADNMQVKMGSSPTSGLHLYFYGIDTFAEASSLSDGAGDGDAPTNYTAMTTSNQVFDATGDPTTSTGRIGYFCRTTMGVDSTYAGGGDSATALPDLVYSYDEA